MPYASNEDLPKAVRDALPDAAQTMWRKAHDAALKEYGDDGKASATAWAAVKRKYRKAGDRWVEKADDGSAIEKAIETARAGLDALFDAIRLTKRAEEVDPQEVYDYLAETYPASALKWVKDATWTRRTVPLEDIKMARRPGGRDPDKVAAIADAIEAGKKMDPVVLVETSDGLELADGYHRTLAFQKAGRKTIDAYVATGAGEHGPWETQMHAAKLNKVLDLTRRATLGLIKAVDDDSMHYTLGVAYPADGLATDRVDAHNEFMSAAELEITAWHWMAVHREINIEHADGTVGHGTTVESYIYRGPDWEVPLPGGSTYVVKMGDWLLGTIWDDAAWELVQKGYLSGWSVEGTSDRQSAAAPAA